MNLKLKIYLIALLLFTTYMFSANYIFNAIIKVENESSRVNFDLQEPGRPVLMGIGVVEETVVRWKEIITIRGWGFLSGLDADGIQHYILLKKDDKILVFDTVNMRREDVTEHFKDSGLNLDNAGFEANIAKGLLKEGEYQIGLFINAGDEEGYILSDLHLEIK